MKKTAIFYIVLAGVLWGTSGIFVHFLAPLGFTSLQMTTARGLVSFLCVAVYVLIKDPSLLRVRPSELLLYTGIGLGLFFCCSLYYTSMQMTSVSTAVILLYASPVYVMIVSVLFLGEKLTRIKFGALIGITVGCCLVSGIIGGLKFDLLGIVAGFFSGVAYAAYNIFTKLSASRKCNTVSTLFYSFLVMVILALSVSHPVQMLHTIAEQPAVSLPLLIGLGILTFILPYLLYTLSLKELPAGVASALSIIEPMSATIFSVVLFHEKTDIFSFIGIVLILVSVFLLARGENKADESHSSS